MQLAVMTIEKTKYRNLSLLHKFLNFYPVSTDRLVPHYIRSDTI